MALRHFSREFAHFWLLALLQMETTGNVDKQVYIKYKQTEKEIAKLEETVRISGEQKDWGLDLFAPGS